VLGHPPGIVKCPAEEHLDLSVEAAKLIGRPSGERVVDGGVEAQRDLLALDAHV